jgi:hypothetical protein
VNEGSADPRQQVLEVAPVLLEKPDQECMTLLRIDT